MAKKKDDAPHVCNLINNIRNGESIWFCPEPGCNVVMTEEEYRAAQPVPCDVEEEILDEEEEEE